MSSVYQMHWQSYLYIAKKLIYNQHHLYKIRFENTKDLPLQGPIIINVQTSYLPGERVALNCTSAPSKPMAILQWSIDGEQVSSSLFFNFIFQLRMI